MDMTYRFPVARDPSPLCGYAERAYFPDPITGKRDHCKHCAERDEYLRLKRIRGDNARLIERRRNGRGIRP